MQLLQSAIPNPCLPTGRPQSAISKRLWQALTVSLLLWLVAPMALAQEPEGLKWGGLLTTGSVEFGTRQTWIGGQQEVYRSHINLGSGVRLFDLSLESRSPDNVGPIYDFLSFSMNSWGGDPYNTMRLRVERRLRYRFDFNYRRLEYVNLLPTFANPLLGQGLMINQHSFNQARRISSSELTLFPDTKFQVRLGYDRNYAFGTNLTTFSIGLDEFVFTDPVRTTSHDYRIGVDARLGKLDLTVEQNFRVFKDDVAIFQPPGLINYGNSPSRGPVGATNPQQILLTAFHRNDGVRSLIPATRLGLHSRVNDQLTLTGRVAYSDADVDFNSDEILSGNLFNRAALSFFTGQTSNVLANASRPSTVANAGVTYRPIPRLTLSNIADFNHFVTSGSSLIRTLQTLGNDFRGNPPPPNQTQLITSDLLNERTSIRSFRNRAEASVEVIPRLTLRGGYRFTGRRAVLDIPAFTGGHEESELKTHTGIAGFSVRALNNLRFFAQFERGSADNVFTRIAPHHVTRLRANASYQPLATWRLSGQYMLNDSRNPNPFVDNLQRSRTFNITSSWFPNDRFGLDLGYTRADISSFIDAINPRTRERFPSTYIADDNVVDADVTFAPTRAAQISVGYSLINSQGTFPLNYHQPRAQVSYSFPHRFTWVVAWRWYGYNEKSVSIQDYRAHLLTSSLRISF